jgi:hypothetical protein
MKFLCIAIDRTTKEQIGDEMTVEAADWYYARHMAAHQFREKYPDEKRDWCIDSIEIED